MKIYDKIEILVDMPDVSLTDVERAFEYLEFNRKQCMEILRHVKWLKKQVKKDVKDGRTA